jgi:hypothetical protein
VGDSLAFGAASAMLFVTAQSGQDDADLLLRRELAQGRGIPSVNELPGVMAGISPSEDDPKGGLASGQPSLFAGWRKGPE